MKKLNIYILLFSFIYATYDIGDTIGETYNVGGDYQCSHTDHGGKRFDPVNIATIMRFSMQIACKKPEYPND